MAKNITLSEQLIASRRSIMEAICRLNNDSICLAEQRKQRIEDNPNYVKSEEYGQSLSVSYQLRRIMKELQNAYDGLGNTFKRIG